MDKHLPQVAVTVALLAQGAAVIWTVSSMVGSIEKTSNDVSQMQSRMSDYEDEMHQAELVVTRIDANLEAIRGAIDLMVAAR